ncbi:MAG: ABC transporter permease, partial [Candidatus Acidiferrales bacterium]
VALLTEPLAALAFPGEDPVGKEIRVGELHFTVIGVFRERVSTFGQSEITRDSLLVAFPLIKYYTGTDSVATLYAETDSPDTVPLVTSQVSQLLENRHRPGAKYLVQNLTGILDTARHISLALTVTLIVIALIALVISGIGIMNIMLVTVTERTREIGIRMAIGAPRDAILYQFLMEALMISGTGALVGIGIAVLIPAGINVVIGLFPEIGNVSIPVSWISVVLAFVVSCSTGLLFGYLPASRASRLHPTESLRYE